MESKLLDIVLLLFFCGSVFCATTVQHNTVAQLTQKIPDTTTATVPGTTVANVTNTISSNNSSTNGSEVIPSHVTTTPKNQDAPINVSPKGVDNHTQNATAALENQSTAKKHGGETTAMPQTPTIHPDDKTGKTTAMPQTSTIHPDDKTGKTTASPTTTATVPSSTDKISTVKPKVEERQKDRQFDGPSFIGGIILALGLTGIGFVAYKFCKSRTDRNYRNL